MHLDVRCARAEDLHKRAWVRLGRDRVRVKLRLTLRLRLEGRVRSRRHEPGPSATTESGSHSSGTTWSAARSWGSSRNAGRLPSCLASDDSSPTSVSWIECWALRLWGGAAAFRGRSVPPSSAHVKRLARSTLTSKRKANAMRYGWSLITTLSRRSSGVLQGACNGVIFTQSVAGVAHSLPGGAPPRCGTSLPPRRAWLSTPEQGTAPQTDRSAWPPP